MIRPLWRTVFDWLLIAAVVGFAACAAWTMLSHIMDEPSAFESTVSAVKRPQAHKGEASWSIQGLYSTDPTCKNQPGTYPFYVEAGGAEFFLECRPPSMP